MTFATIGDLAQQLTLSRHSALHKGRLDQLGNTLSTGLKPDIGKAVRGDFAYLGDLEHQLKTSAARHSALSGASALAAVAQESLGHIQSISEALAGALLTADTTQQMHTLYTVAGQAESDFSRIVGALNGTYANRHLFSGVATDNAPLAAPEDMLNALRTATSGAVTSADVIQIVGDWFMTAGGGFETMGYLGGGSDLSPVQLGEGAGATPPPRADDPAVRAMLRDVALAALSGDAAQVWPDTTRRAMASNAAESLMTGQSDFVGLRAELGVAEEQIESSLVREGARLTALEISRNDIVAADPFETAIQMEAAQKQLESLYLVTARLSRLSLTEYLR